MSEPKNPQLQGSQSDGSAAGGWPALNAVNKHLLHQHVLLKGNRTLLSMNKPDGFDCPSCAWPDPKKPHTFEYCENGAKALAWESTKKRVTPEFFAEHTVSELATWSDHDLEDQGRITEPMRYDGQRQIPARQLGRGVRRNRAGAAPTERPVEAGVVHLAAYLERGGVYVDNRGQTTVISNVIFP